MTKPTRIQRKRTKGFDLQAVSRAINGLECVYVGRPTKWGNPYAVGDNFCLTPSDAVERYMKILPNRYGVRQLQVKLAGKNLACWCALDKPCHADVLLELANGDAE